MVNLEIASTLAFFAFVALLVYRDRKNIDFNYGLIIKRWTRGKELIDVFVKRYRRYLPIIGSIGIVAGLISAVLMTGILVYFDVNNIPAIGIVTPSAGGVSVPGTVP